MRRIAASVAWVGITASAAGAFGQDAPPPLTPPLTEPVAEPSPPKPPLVPAPPIVPAPMPVPGQVLVLPGITTPRTAPKPMRLVSPPVVAPAVKEADAIDLPPLVDPAQAPIRRNAARPAFADPATPALGPTGRPPLTLESVPAGMDNDPSALTPPISATPPREDSPPRASTTPAPALAPRRRPFGLFDRLLPPDRRNAMDNGVKVAPSNDPETEAALKRRIDRRIREDFGARVKAYEVQVGNGEVVIRARASRFWFRRGLQSGLEALPELRGYRAIVEVTD